MGGGRGREGKSAGSPRASFGKEHSARVCVCARTHTTRRKFASWYEFASRDGVGGRGGGGGGRRRNPTGGALLGVATAVGMEVGVVGRVEEYGGGEGAGGGRRESE
jgi:hypothetical protein